MSNFSRIYNQLEYEQAAEQGRSAAKSFSSTNDYRVVLGNDVHGDEIYIQTGMEACSEGGKPEPCVTVHRGRDYLKTATFKGCMMINESGKAEFAMRPASWERMVAIIRDALHQAKCAEAGVTPEQLHQHRMQRRADERAEKLQTKKQLKVEASRLARTLTALVQGDMESSHRHEICEDFAWGSGAVTAKHFVTGKGLAGILFTAPDVSSEQLSTWFFPYGWEEDRPELSKRFNWMLDVIVAAVRKSRELEERKE